MPHFGFLITIPMFQTGTGTTTRLTTMHGIHILCSDTETTLVYV